MADMKGTMAKEKEELKRDKDLLTKELKFQEAMIKSLVPHSVEHVQLLDQEMGLLQFVY